MNQDDRPVTHSEAYATQREVDLRIRSVERESESRWRSAEEALRLAREAYMTAFENTNNFRREATEDKAKYSEQAWVASELARMEQLLRTDFVRELQQVETKVLGQLTVQYTELTRDLQSQQAQITAMRSSQTTLGTDVRGLENSSNILRGRNLGIAGLLFGVAGSVILGIVNFLK